MPDTFQKKRNFEVEENFANVPQILSLTEDIVYCPKCGTINSFKKSEWGRILNYFCTRCSLNMTEIWNKYLQGHIGLINCRKCGEKTFRGFFHCIACGSKQKKAFSDRTDKISDARGIDIDLFPTSRGAAISDALECCDFFTCCCSIGLGACIPVQLSASFTSVLKTAFSVSFVLSSMFSTIFYILFFHSLINTKVLYGVLSVSIILAIVVPIILHKFFVKAKVSEKNTYNVENKK